MSPQDLADKLSKFPRTSLCALPSPVHSWDRLSSQWSFETPILAKRDDLIGVAFGGNKSRQLEFILGEAIAQGCDSVIHGGAIQSNYCRQLAAACASLGLETFLVLSNSYDQEYDQGSHLIDQIMGANISIFDGPLGVQHEARKARLAEELKAQGRKPYLITYPHSEILGSLSYVAAAIEITKQIPIEKFPERIVMPAVGASYAGLLFGLNLLGKGDVELIGIAPLSDEYPIVETIQNSLRHIAKLLGIELDESIFKQIQISNDWVGEGYAKVSDAGLSALVEVAKYTGVLLDPVYTSKAAAAMKALQNKNRKTMFWHTGGAPAIFAYHNEIVKFLREHQ